MAVAEPPVCRNFLVPEKHTNQPTNQRRDAMRVSAFLVSAACIFNLGLVEGGQSYSEATVMGPEPTLVELSACDTEAEHKCSENGKEWCCPKDYACIYDGSGKGGCRASE